VKAFLFSLGCLSSVTQGVGRIPEGVTHRSDQDALEVRLNQLLDQVEVFDALQIFQSLNFARRRRA